MSKELEVLSEQLEELLSAGAVDFDDALEIAVVAGLVSRLGGDTSAADAWKAGIGAELVEKGFAELDLAEVVDGVEGVADGQATPLQVEEALYELDEWVAAAIWSGKQKLVAPAARSVAATIRMIPDSFAPVAELGAEMSSLPAIAQEMGLYDFWMAVADAATWAEAEE